MPGTTRIGRVRLLTAAALTATIACVGAIRAQPSAAETPSGYAQIITLDLANDGRPSTCQLARVDLDSNGGVTPIGTVFNIATDDFPLGAGQLLAALAIDEPECTPDTPTTTTTVPPAEPIASPARFTG